MAALRRRRRGSCRYVYPLTDGLRSGTVTAAHRQGARPLCKSGLSENLPESLSGFTRLAGRGGVCAARIHFPPSAAERRLRMPGRRFIYEEFLLLQLGLASRRREVRTTAAGLPILPTTCRRSTARNLRRLFHSPSPPIKTRSSPRFAATWPANGRCNAFCRPMSAPARRRWLYMRS